MAQVKRRGEGRYLIRVSKGSGKNREFINETFYGSLADARAHAREIEMTVHREPDDFKTKLLASLHDPIVADAVINVVRSTIQRDSQQVRNMLRAVN
jgi:hypothetical protein